MTARQTSAPEHRGRAQLETFFTSQIKMAGSGGRLLHFRQFLSTHSTIKGKKCWLELLPIFVQQCRVALTIQSFTKQFIENKISVCLAGASNS